MIQLQDMNKGFTLIELLITISIISILSVFVISNIRDAQDKAKVNKSRLELRQLQNIIFDAQTISSGSVASITESGCTDCACRTVGSELSNLEDSHPCVSRWRNAITAIIQEVNPSLDSSVYYEDTWGSPYLLDENEMKALKERVELILFVQLVQINW